MLLHVTPYSRPAAAAVIARVPPAARLRVLARSGGRRSKASTKQAPQQQQRGRAKQRFVQPPEAPLTVAEDKESIVTFATLAALFFA